MKDYFPFDERKAIALAKLLFSFRENRYCDFRKIALVAYCIEREFWKKYDLSFIGGRFISEADGMYNLDFLKKVLLNEDIIEFYKNTPSDFNTFSMAKLKEAPSLETLKDEFSEFEWGIICQKKYKKMMEDDLSDTRISAMHYCYKEWLNGKIGHPVSVLDIVNPDFKEDAIRYINDYEELGLYSGQLSF